MKLIKPLLVYPKQAQQILGIGTTQFYKLNKLADFPKPRNPLSQRPMYVLKELEEWVNNLPEISNE